ncbi:MAG: PIN domain-containing protein [Thaumarchaeota archaeon]|nr:PIN domain-containing protein [Nitrososphaerota archaeon]
MKSYVADTVSLARYFEDSLPSKAEMAFREAEDGKARILVPGIVIAEFIYIALKGRLKTPDPKATIRELLSEIQASTFLQQATMTQDSWERFLESKVRELHDRIIHSISLSSNASGIITNDEELKSSGFRTIW